MNVIVIVLREPYLLFWHFINAYHFGPYTPSSSIEELNGLGKMLYLGTLWPIQPLFSFY